MQGQAMRGGMGVGGGGGGHGASGTLGRINTFSSSRRQRQCPNCRDRGVVILDQKSGDELCSNCGQILEAKIMSEEQEWRVFSNSDGGSGADKSRVGGPTDSWLDNGSGGTSMMGGDKKYEALSHRHEMATGLNSGDRQLKAAFANLRLIADHFALKEITLERAKEKVKDLQTAGNLKSRTGPTHMLAVVYLACREENQPMSIATLASFDAALAQRDIGRAINRIKKLIPETSNSLESTGERLFASQELASRFCMSLQLASNVKDLVCTVCSAAERARFSIPPLPPQQTPAPPRPHILAGAVIYIVTQLLAIKIDLSLITQTARCGLEPMREVYKIIKLNIRHLLPKNFIPQNPGGYNALHEIP